MSLYVEQKRSETPYIVVVVIGRCLIAFKEIKLRMSIFGEANLNLSLFKKDLTL